MKQGSSQVLSYSVVGTKVLFTWKRRRRRLNLFIYERRIELACYRLGS